MASEATIYDVADVAGVSPATVSRVMNGSRLIEEESRGKVLRAARKVGYEAKRVRRQRERAILNVKLVLPRHESGLKRLFYDFSELADGLRAGLAPCELRLASFDQVTLLPNRVFVRSPVASPRRESDSSGPAVRTLRIRRGSKSGRKRTHTIAFASAFGDRAQSQL